MPVCEKYFLCNIVYNNIIKFNCINICIICATTIEKISVIVEPYIRDKKLNVFSFIYTRIEKINNVSNK